jgi:hypothetical protein
VTASSGGGTEPEPSPAASDRPVRVRWLSKWERAAAAAVGIASIATGGTAVFVSGNQAGTTALLLIGSLFTLLGIQGTPIRSATKDSVQLERRLVEEVNTLVEQGKAEAAIPVLEAVKSSTPEIADSPAVKRVEDLAYQSINYEEAVVDAFWRLLAEDLHGIYRPLDGPWDIVVVDRSNKEVAQVIVKYVSPRHPSPSAAIQRFYRSLERADRASIPTIGVISRSPGRYSISLTGVEIAVWEGAGDDARLAKAMSDAGLHLQ